MAGRTNRYRRGEKSTDVRIGYIGNEPALIANWGGRKYGAPLSLVGSGNIQGSSSFGNIRVKGDAVFDSGASVLRIKGDGISIKESNVEVAKFGATTTVKDINLTGKIVITSTGTSNVVIGDAACNDAGEANVVLGVGAGALLTSANIENVIIGKDAGAALSGENLPARGDYNTLIGAGAGAALTHGYDNICIGRASGDAMTDNHGTVAIGANALTVCESGGTSNTSIGDASGFKVTTGTSNVIVGKGAGSEITTGDGNICMGQQAGEWFNGSITQGIGTGDYNTFIGYYTHPSAANISREIVIGAGAVTAQGTETVTIGRTSDYITCDFGENATWSHSSDFRIKKDITDNNLGLSFINDLRTVTFKKKASSEYPEAFESYESDNTERKNPDLIHYGFIAQEVKEAMDKANHPEFTVWKEGRDGMQSLGEVEFITPLIKAVQELSAKLDNMDTRLTNLEAV